MNKIYEPQIDGLRAISVLSVIIYHLNIFFLNKKILPGGFLGVDFFFIISGYLITNIILREIQDKKKFSFKNFYERRVRRIIPLYFLVLLICSFFSYLILLPNSIIDYSKSTVSSIFFFSNFYFHYSSTLYGSEDALLKPLLHTWTLSIENQFYIIYPIFLFFLIKFHKKYLFYYFILIFISSIFFATLISKHHPSFNFYISISRVFEIILGAILAYLGLNSKLKKYFLKPLKINTVLPLAGAGLITLSLIFFNDQMLLPSLYTLIPCAGVSLIILYSNVNSLVAKFLSNKLIIFIGLISYSLYLWHYPLFSFLRHLNLLDQIFLVKIGAIFFLFMLSIFSFYFIEKPFRNKTFISFQNVNIFIFILLFTILINNLTFLKKEGLADRFPKVISNVYQDIQALYPDRKQELIYSKNILNKNIVLIGDSMAESFLLELNEAAKKNNLNLFYFSTYFFINDFNRIYKKSKLPNKNFVEENKRIRKFLDENDDLTVILSTMWTYKINKADYIDNKNLKYKFGTDSFFGPIDQNYKEYNYDIFEKNIISTINSILSRGHKVILVNPIPSFSEHIPRHVYSNYFFNKKIIIYSEDYDVYKNINKDALEAFNKIKHKNFYQIYPDSFFCNLYLADKCVANLENEIFFRDNSHLTQSASKYLVEDLINVIKIQINKPF
jgi:peptidoglycan/LPS O-acetylase OafA/YrhL